MKQFEKLASIKIVSGRWVMSPIGTPATPSLFSSGFVVHLLAPSSADSSGGKLVAGWLPSPRSRSAAHPGLQVVQISFSTGLVTH